MPLDRRAQRLLDMLAASGPAQGADASPAERRAALESLAEAADDTSAPALTETYTIDGPGGPLAVRLYHAPDAASGPAPALVYFHGGGWVAGGLATHDGVCRRLCVASGATVLAVDYRLAPEHPFPAAYNDALAATRWTFAHAIGLGLNPRRIAVGGDSVGAGLAAAVAQGARELPIAAQLLICPILDVAAMTPSREAFARGYFLSHDAFARDLADYAGADAPTDDLRLSPARADDLAGLAPALIHTAEYDPFRDGGEAYRARLRTSGVPATAHRHAGMIHYFYALARAIPYAAQAAMEIGRELRVVLAARD